MKTKEITLIPDADTSVFVYCWLPDDGITVKGIFQIAHGMAEHAARYTDFAAFLTSKGYIVFANDHRGHGKTIGSIEETGFLGVNNSWKAVLSDMLMVNSHIHQEYPEHNIYLFGHSMGSFYARAYLEHNSATIQALILSGTAWQPTLMLNAGLMIARIQCSLRGEHYRSHLLDTMSFGAFNRKFEPAQTAFDWLSRDHSECVKYSLDPYCGFVCSASFFRELFRLLKYVHKKNLYESVDKSIPVLIFSGSMDPVGNFSKGPKTMNDFLKKKGFTKVTLHIYLEGRHEMLNEINKEEVYEDVLRFVSDLRAEI